MRNRSAGSTRIFSKRGLSQSPREFTAAVTRLFEDRQSRDYDVAGTLTEGEARQDVADAGKILKAVRSCLESGTAGQTPPDPRTPDPRWFESTPAAPGSIANGTLCVTRNDVRPIMTHVTLSIDEEALKKARIRALEQGTSVNAVLRDLLEAYAGVQTAQTAATQDLLALSRQSTASRGERRRTRDELHDRP
jgi:hypothetical protein